MSDELLLSFEMKTDNFIEQTNTYPQKTLEPKLRESMVTISFQTPLKKDKNNWLLDLLNLGVYNSFLLQLMKMIVFTFYRWFLD